MASVLVATHPNAMQPAAEGSSAEQCLLLADVITSLRLNRAGNAPDEPSGGGTSIGPPGSGGGGGGGGPPSQRSTGTGAKNDSTDGDGGGGDGGESGGRRPTRFNALRTLDSRAPVRFLTCWGNMFDYAAGPKQTSRQRWKQVSASLATWAAHALVGRLLH